MSNSILIYASCGGRFGNQLLALSMIYAYWLDSKKQCSILMLSFWPYLTHMQLKGPFRYGYFSKDGSHSLLFMMLFFIYSTIPKSLKTKFHALLIISFHTLAHILPGMQSIFNEKSSIWTYIQRYCKGIHSSDFNLTHTTKKLLDKKITVFSGFDILNWNLFDTYKNELGDFIRFKQPFYNKSSAIVDSLKKQYDILIGIHIRAGDHLINPILIPNRISFEPKVFIDIMHQEKKKHGNKNIAFLLSSDSPIDHALFSEFNIYISSGSFENSGSICNSILELSFCDYCIISPSTFSAFLPNINNSKCFIIFYKNSIKVLESKTPLKDVLSYWETEIHINHDY